MGKKIRVCHLTTVHPFFDTRIFYKECKSLRDAGYDVVLIAPHNKNEMVDGVRIVGLPMFKNRILRMSYSAVEAFFLAAEQRAAIYHFHDPELIWVGLLLRSLGKKVIYDAHEDVPEDMLTKEWIPGIVRRMISVLFGIFEKWASKQMSFIVTATPVIYEKFIGAGCRADCVNNYPLVNEFYSLSTDCSKREKAVAYVGAIGKSRGIFEMTKAVNIVDIKLLLAGQFYSAKERRISIAMPGWIKVKELGRLNRREIAVMLSNSIAGLVIFHPVPNHANAQPNKMFEYMSAGIPVIASNFPLWKEIIERNECGLCVDPLQPTSIARAISWLIDNPDSAKRMGDNGRKAIVAKYNWENENKKLFKIYKEYKEI